METPHQQTDNLFAEWNRADSPGCAPAVIKVIFQRSAGRVSGFTLNAGRVRNVQFDRL